MAGGPNTVALAEADFGNSSELAERSVMDVEAGAQYKGQWLGQQKHGKGILT